ncbi:DUF7144 family membrane protein [Jatrophihabitans sp. DSM 45814]
MVKGEGWWIFAGTMIGIAGIMRLFDAIWAFRYDGVLPSNLEGAIFGHSLNTYGWVYLIVAIVLGIGSVAIFMGSAVGRWIGVIAAALLAISAVWWMPYYPVWSLTYVFIALLVVYALVVYGGREAVESQHAAKQPSHTPAAS